MAVRFKCPIFTYNEILDKAGVVLEDEEELKGESEKTSEQPADSIESMSVDALEQMLDKVLKEENYEKAAEIRDEINRRKGEGGEN